MSELIRKLVYYDDEGDNVFESSLEDGKKRGEIMETYHEKDIANTKRAVHRNMGKYVKSLEKLKGSEEIDKPFYEAMEDEEQIKHVTYNDTVEVFQVDSIQDNEETDDESLDSSSTGGPSISEYNFKRKVTFSNEIIVIAYDNEDVETNAYNDVDQHVEEVDGSPYRGVFCGDKQEEMTVNRAEMANKNIFKAVSFANEVTVIDDGDLVFTSHEHQMNSRVDKLLEKLKRVVNKLEDNNKHANHTRDKKVLGDAQQDRSLHQVEIVRVDKDGRDLDTEDAEPPEPNLRRVTFSKEIIVIAYPHDDWNDAETPGLDDLEIDWQDACRTKDKDMETRDWKQMETKGSDGMKIDNQQKKEIVNQDSKDIENLDWQETETQDCPVEESLTNYAPTSREQMTKSVSFSHEVTVIHDRNLEFSDSDESIKLRNEE